uniref:Voltage-dependent T-type calcium channel subunit alpha-1H n=1 Tax=Zonotrichia albicollis TaxID=44394 RepID=A0A8D2MCJ0_ZONAL
MLVILLNCVTLGMFQPCEDVECQSERCTILEAFDDFIFAFFAVEMVIKMVALGIFGQKCYLGDTWNRLDFFIVMAGSWGLNVGMVICAHPDVAFPAPPGMRILVTLLLDTLPMLGNVLLLCFFVFFIFGIVGVQLWAGLLRNRCFLDRNFAMTYNLTFLHPYYRPDEAEENPFICSSHRENGMQRCSNIPSRKESKVECTLSMESYSPSLASPEPSRNSCINWNQYYNICMAGDVNPHNGAINFDNIGYAWIAIFQVITLEGWVDIMYYVMDAHSFYNFIYFILLIIVGSFFMINLCLVVIATQFSETKQRENQLMQEQRARYLSNDSTIASFSEPGSCYEELLKYICHIFRKVKRRTIRLYNNWQSKRRKKVNPNSSGGGQSQRSRRRITSIHHLIHHHHHHHHHHYHISNGSPRGPRANPELCELELQVMKPGRQLMLPPPASPRPQGPAGAVHSIYHADCHVEGPPGGCRAASSPVGTKLAGLGSQGSMNYPTILPSPGGRAGSAALPKGKKNRNSPVAVGNSPGSLGLDSYGKLQQLVGEHGKGNRAGVCLGEGQMGQFCTRGAGCGFQGCWMWLPGVLDLWKAFGTKLKRIVESKYFNRGIMIAILINTLSMGIEYHEQPDELTNALEISNIVFTSMFALEMLLKLLAFGIFGYIKNPYNIFDGIIVVIRCFPHCGFSAEGWGVGWRSGMAREIQLVVLMKTMDNVATFCMLLMLFIFIFSILGMHLFGCKFSLKTDTGDTVPDRKNFDSLLWAIVTVFQILTQEDWNVVLYNGMASTSSWAALYFVALMTFGNYVLFNLLVAILVEGFQAEGDANRSDTDEDKTSANFEDEFEKLKDLRATEMKMYSLAVTPNGHLEGLPFSPFPKPSEFTDSHTSLLSQSSLRSSPCANWATSSTWGRKKRCSFFFTQSYCYRIRKALEPYKPKWCKTHENWSLYLFSPQNRFRVTCQKVIAHKMFDHVVLVFIFLNCITIALERPDIDPLSTERIFLSVSNYIFTAIFVVEMMVKVVALGFFSGENTYLQSSWNVLDGVLVFVSIIDIIVSMASAGGAKILGVLRVLRLLRTLRPLRVISRAPGLKLVVETLISSLRPIGNIVLICCAFFIIFGILGVQLFKGKFYYCDGPDVKNITTKADCTNAHYKWVRRKYNFDNLGQALMSLFVLSSKDGWVNIMYDGLDAVGIDQQPIQNHNPWMLLYFISFLLIVSFFVLNMFVGVVVENFHKCRQHQEAEEARRREEKRLRRLEKKRRSKEMYLSALKYCNYVFTIVFVFEALLKLVAFGFRRFFKDRWNQLDLAIVLLSIVGITLEEIEMNAALPINPTIIRIMRVLRIARGGSCSGLSRKSFGCLSFPPWNLGLLFMLLFFIYAALGVELFGKLDCSEENPCEGLSRHATFTNFGMAFLTLFRVSTGDNWNGIMKDTLRECTREDKHCLSYLPVISPVYFVTFVLIAQFVLVNVVVAVLMKHLEESNKEAKEDAEMDAEIELEIAASLRAQDSQNLLTVRKISVSRMHSLPNDSYMFRPVAPATAPLPLHEVEMETYPSLRPLPTQHGSIILCPSLEVLLPSTSPGSHPISLLSPSRRPFGQTQ